jgi:hypothetical protein
MFVGHLGVGLALKTVEPKINVGILLFASLFLDLLLGLFVLAGLEQILVPVNYSQLHYLHFSFPYSHSLIAALLWSFAASCLAYVMLAGYQQFRLKAAMVISAAILLHWLCDWLEHPSQLPVAGESSRMLGLGLWNHMETALALEVLLVAAGTILYLRGAKKIGSKARLSMLLLMLLLVVVAVAGQATVTQAPQQVVLATSLVVQSIVIRGLCAWIDRAREGIASE